MDTTYLLDNYTVDDDLLEEDGEDLEDVAPDVLDGELDGEDDDDNWDDDEKLAFVFDDEFVEEE